MVKAINLAKPDRPVHVGVILTGGETEILDVAPVDIFNGMDKKFLKHWPEGLLPEGFREQAHDFEFHWITENGKTGRLTGGLTVQATDDFASCPPLDIVMMGAHVITYKLTENELAYIRKAYDECAAFIAICGGMLAPMEAGLLEGKQATAPREMLGMLRQTAPGVDWQEKRWHNEGKMWTSGALLNGLDLVRVFVHDLWGGEDTLADWILDVGHWPKRDVRYDGPVVA